MERAAHKCCYGYHHPTSGSLPLRSPRPAPLALPAPGLFHPRRAPDAPVVWDLESEPQTAGPAARTRPALGNGRGAGRGRKRAAVAPCQGEVGGPRRRGSRTCTRQPPIPPLGSQPQARRAGRFLTLCSRLLLCAAILEGRCGRARLPPEQARRSAARAADSRPGGPRCPGAFAQRPATAEVALSRSGACAQARSSARALLTDFLVRLLPVHVYLHTFRRVPIM